MKGLGRLWIAMVLGASLASCGAMEKAPAQAALTTAQSAFDAVKDNAAKVLPDETKGVQDALDAAKASFDQGDYKAALETAKALPDRVKTLSDQVATKMTELESEWQGLSAAMPEAVSNLQSAVSKLKKAPAGMDATEWDGLKNDVTSAGQMWQEAEAAAQGGDVATAMSKAGEVKKITFDAMTALKMPVPDALK
jgi:hypothetical protein